MQSRMHKDLRAARRASRTVLDTSAVDGSVRLIHELAAFDEFVRIPTVAFAGHLAPKKDVMAVKNLHHHLLRLTTTLPVLLVHPAYRTLILIPCLPRKPLGMCRCLRLLPSRRSSMPPLSSSLPSCPIRLLRPFGVVPFGLRCPRLPLW